VLSLAKIGENDVTKRMHGMQAENVFSTINQSHWKDSMENSTG